MSGNTPATDLRNAALVVEQPGTWTRDTMFAESGGRVCALGAIEVAVAAKITTLDRARFHADPLPEVFWGANRKRVVAATHALAGTIRPSVPQWNDTVVTGPEEVAAQMRLAADRWEAENQLAQSVRQADLDLASGPVV